MNSATRSDLIPVGETAPDFTVEASDGTTVHLAELHGKKRVVLVFYPGDNTPGCTAQLCALRDDWSTLQAAEAVVYGVNPAGAEKHAAFVQKYSFPYPLIIDQGGKLAAAYGCRMLFGLIRRSVYVIDRQGRVIFARRGSPAPAEMLDALRKAQD